VFHIVLVELIEIEFGPGVKPEAVDVAERRRGRDAVELGSLGAKGLLSSALSSRGGEGDGVKTFDQMLNSTAVGLGREG
jgi:hypothetical protein